MTEDDPERLARIAHEADAAWYEAGYPDTWPYENRKPWAALDDGARAWCAAIADAVAAEVRRQERATLSVLLESAEHGAADYWDGVGCLDDGEARRYGELNGAVNGLRTALAALEEDR